MIEMPSEVLALLGTMSYLELKELMENWIEIFIISLVWICGIISDVAS